MMRLVLLFISFFIYITDTNAQLQEGDKAPFFTLFDQNNQVFDASRHIGKHPVVLFFYPRDDSPGCTKEVCSFRDKYEDYQKIGTVVVGINPGSIMSHKKFSDKHKLQYSLLSDSKNDVADLFGVETSLLGYIVSRVTFVINKEGIIEKIIKEQPADMHSDISYKTLTVKAQVAK
ncbi:MAG: peroxiredoxin [Cytophagales bacterium]|nr:peroxiredoxin [Cytophagales bacterium]